MSEKKSKSTWFKWVFLLGVLGGFGWGGHHLYSKRSESILPAFQTAVVERGSIVQRVMASGELNPVLNVEVGSQVSGIIHELLADFNAPVRAGQVLARLEPSTFEANVRQAEAELASARAAYELSKVNAARAGQLRERELISQSELDQALANLQQADASVQIRMHALDRAKTELARTTIYAPIDGIVISRNVDVGQTVAASLSAPVLFVIANDLSRMQINAKISEADIGMIGEGQRVTFSVDAFPGQAFSGQVHQVRNAPIIQNNVVTYDTVISVHNPRGILKPGMTANVSVIVEERHDVLRISNASLRVRLPDHLQPPPPATEPDPAETAPGARESGRGPGGGGEWGGRRTGGGRPEGFGGGSNAGSSRTVYRVREGVSLESVSIRTGVTDGIHTEVVSGVADGDILLTGLALAQSGRPDAARRPQQNPFMGGPRRF